MTIKLSSVGVDVHLTMPFFFSLTHLFFEQNFEELQMKVYSGYTSSRVIMHEGHKRKTGRHRDAK